MRLALTELYTAEDARQRSDLQADCNTAPSLNPRERENGQGEGKQTEQRGGVTLSPRGRGFGWRFGRRFEASAERVFDGRLVRLPAALEASRNNVTIATV